LLVLSLAFILAFVFSAIVLLIGIIIFSEIAEAMEITLPTIAVIIPESNEWQLREQESNAGFTVGCDFIQSTVALGVDLFPDNTFIGYCHVFKVFDKADVIGKDLRINWRQDLASVDSRIHVLDGAYNRNNATEFPLDATASPSSAGFTNTLTEGLKGGGVLHNINRVGVFALNDTITLTLAGSTEDQITVNISIYDRSLTLRPAMVIFDVEINATALWKFGTNNGATVTMAVTGTQNDLGVANAGFVNLKTAPPLTPEEQQQVDTFSNAQAIGFTVIGILPVALFFALFSIFSGRIE